MHLYPRGGLHDLRSSCIIYGEFNQVCIKGAGPGISCYKLESEQHVEDQAAPCLTGKQGI